MQQHTTDFAPPPAPRLTARLVLLAAVWSFAVLHTGTKKSLEATPQPAAQQIAVRVIPTPAMEQFMTVRHVAVSANVSVQPAQPGAIQVISVEVDAQPTPQVVDHFDQRVVSTR